MRKSTLALPVIAALLLLIYFIGEGVPLTQMPMEAAKVVIIVFTAVLGVRVLGRVAGLGKRH